MTCGMVTGGINMTCGNGDAWGDEHDGACPRHAHPPPILLIPASCSFAPVIIPSILLIPPPVVLIRPHHHSPRVLFTPPHSTFCPTPSKNMQLFKSSGIFPSCVLVLYVTVRS